MSYVGSMSLGTVLHGGVGVYRAGRGHGRAWLSNGAVDTADASARAGSPAVTVLYHVAVAAAAAAAASRRSTTLQNQDIRIVELNGHGIRVESKNTILRAAVCVAAQPVLDHTMRRNGILGFYSVHPVRTLYSQRSFSPVLIRGARE